MHEHKPSFTEIETPSILVLPNTTNCKFASYITNTENLDSIFLSLSSNKPFFISDHEGP